MVSSSVLAATHEVFLQKKGIGKVFDCFLNLLKTLENYPAMCEILGPIQRTSCGKRVCLCDFYKNFLKLSFDF